MKYKEKTVVKYVYYSLLIPILIFFIVTIISFFSCNTKKRNMNVHQFNGKGLNYTHSYIGVDSVTETTPTSATFWIDGRKTTVYAERIMISE